MKIPFHDKFIFIPFDNACVLFNEDEQSVLILNDVAAFIWCASFEVDSQDELITFVAGQYGISLSRAQQDIEHFFESFKTNCLFLIPEKEPGSFLKPLKAQIPLCEKSSESKAEALVFSINHLSFQLVVPSAVLWEELSRIYHYFLDSSKRLNQPETIRQIEVSTDGVLFSIYVDGLCVYTGLQLNEVVPFVFGVVFETLWKSDKYNLKSVVDHQASETKLMFHAAILGNKEGEMVLFPGESGAGKSTLSAMLAAKQWLFFSDELAIVLPEKSRVLACPLPVCVKEGAVEALLEFYPELEHLMLHHRLDDKKACYLPMKSPGAVAEATIQAIVFPGYDDSITCELRSIKKSEALGRLLSCGSSGRAMTLEELSSVMTMVERLPCYTLIYSDIDSAVIELEKCLALK